MATLHIRSYITQGDGRYRFHGLSQDIDYQLRARYKGQTGKSEILHWYDGRRDARINLTVRLRDDVTPDAGSRPPKQLRERHKESQQ